jgi:hypothetical protein
MGLRNASSCPAVSSDKRILGVRTISWIFCNCGKRAIQHGHLHCLYFWICKISFHWYKIYIRILLWSSFSASCTSTAIRYRSISLSVYAHLSPPKNHTNINGTIELMIPTLYTQTKALKGIYLTKMNSALSGPCSSNKDINMSRSREDGQRPAAALGGIQLLL